MTLAQAVEAIFFFVNARNKGISCNSYKNRDIAKEVISQRLQRFVCLEAKVKHELKKSEWPDDPDVVPLTDRIKFESDMRTKKEFLHEEMFQEFMADVGKGRVEMDLWMKGNKDCATTWWSYFLEYFILDDNGNGVVSPASVCNLLLVVHEND